MTSGVTSPILYDEIQGWFGKKIKSEIKRASQILSGRPCGEGRLPLSALCQRRLYWEFGASENDVTRKVEKIIYAFQFIISTICFGASSPHTMPCSSIAAWIRNNWWRTPGKFYWAVCTGRGASQTDIGAVGVVWFLGWAKFRWGEFWILQGTLWVIKGRFSTIDPRTMLFEMWSQVTVGLEWTGLRDQSFRTIFLSSCLVFLLAPFSIIVYRIYFYPLSHIPGPFVAKFTHRWQNNSYFTGSWF